MREMLIVVYFLTNLRSLYHRMKPHIVASDETIWSEEDRQCHRSDRFEQVVNNVEFNQSQIIWNSLKTDCKVMLIIKMKLFYAYDFLLVV